MSADVLRVLENKDAILARRAVLDPVGIRPAFTDPEPATIVEAEGDRLHDIGLAGEERRLEAGGQRHRGNRFAGRQRVRARRRGEKNRRENDGKRHGQAWPNHKDLLKCRSYWIRNGKGSGAIHRMPRMSTLPRRLRAGMVGLGMIFDETYRPCFESLRAEGLFRRDFGAIEVELAAVASRTGSRAERYKKDGKLKAFTSFAGADAVEQLLRHDVDVVCVATPDDRHFPVAKAALDAGKHVLIEKPSVLHLHQLDQLDTLARRKGLLAKVVYHKLADPDHKKLRTHVVGGVLQHVNNGYCSLLEPKSISG